jgi:hypothetical protein
MLNWAIIPPGYFGMSVVLVHSLKVATQSHLRAKWNAGREFRAPSICGMEIVSTARVPFRSTIAT